MDDEGRGSEPSRYRIPKKYLFSTIFVLIILGSYCYLVRPFGRDGYYLYEDRETRVVEIKGSHLSEYRDQGNGYYRSYSRELVYDEGYYYLEDTYGYDVDRRLEMIGNTVIYHHRNSERVYTKVYNPIEVLRIYGIELNPVGWFGRD